MTGNIVDLRGDAERRKTGPRGFGRLKPITEPTPAKLNTLRRELAAAKEPNQIIAVGAAAKSFEELIENAGFGRDREKIRPFREVWIESRWRLGHLLAKIERGQVPGSGRGHKGEKSMSRGGTSFRKELANFGINKNRAMEAQRLGAFPEDELRRAFKKFQDDSSLPELGVIIALAKPYWFKAQRTAKHKKIRVKAAAIAVEQGEDSFPLIYADPPWKWGHFGAQDQENEKGKGRTPDQHYPTLTHDELCAFRVHGRLIRNLAHKDAALFLWCTSSNVERALEIMRNWGFEFKSSAVWIKTKDDGVTPITGMGLVFRNAHEVLLYGTKGKMPGPQWQPPSVFTFPRGKHSAKPPAIRAAIERMYPDFGASTRLELFARETVPGWTPYGFEAAGG